MLASRPSLRVTTMPIDPDSSTPSALDRGRKALAAGEWDEAVRAFEFALASGEDPEALEGLGLAAWWTDRGPQVFDARERAFRLYRDRGDVRDRKSTRLNSSHT